MDFVEFFFSFILRWIIYNRCVYATSDELFPPEKCVLFYSFCMNPAKYINSQPAIWMSKFLFTKSESRFFSSSKRFTEFLELLHETIWNVYNKCKKENWFFFQFCQRMLWHCFIFAEFCTITEHEQIRLYYLKIPL